MWSKLPDRFTLSTLKEPLAEVGIDLDDAEHLEEVANFLESLRAEGCLVLEGAENPSPSANSVEARREEIRQIPKIKAKFDYDLHKEGILATVGIELTYRCVEKCVHCFNPKYINGATSCDANGELTTAEIKTLLAEMYEMGVNSISFTGGEVFLRQDFFEILDEVKRLRFSFSISTNGQLLSEETIRKLAGYYPTGVGISVYSANPEIHDATTSVKGSFAKSVQALKLLHEHGIGTLIKSPLMNHTVHGYKELLKLCDNLKATPQFDCTISPSIDGNQYVTLHQIHDREILEQIFREKKMPLYVGLDMDGKGQRMAVDETSCGAGLMNLGICPDGTVYPCNSLPLELGNIRNGGLRKIWEEGEVLKMWNELTVQDTNECGLYRKCSYCNYCAGLAMLQHNDLFRSHSTSCHIAAVRMGIVEKLENNIDPLDEYKRKYGQPFGYDLEFSPPGSTQPTEIRNHDEINLNYVAIDHSGEHFVEKVKPIKQHGNPIRKKKTPEPGSPQDLYNRGELCKDNNEREFLETGR
jgi:radical SAM protein with 4Fe4S-binding SPASM domain